MRIFLYRQDARHQGRPLHLCKFLLIAILLNTHDFTIPLSDVRIILKRLEKDGYVRQANGTVWVLTFDGIFFKESGGYSQENENKLFKIKNEIDQSQRMERNEEQLVNWTQNLADRTKDLTFWTRLVAVGALSLVLWEMIAFLLEHSSRCCSY